LHECVIVDSAQPVSDRVIGDQEVTTRFRFVPAAHGPQLQDRHAFQARVLRSPMGRNSPHARTDDTQLFPQHRHFGFQLMDARVCCIAVLDQRFAACEHCDPHDADHLEHCAADTRLPVPGKA
jgi:hypothetical protein